MNLIDALIDEILKIKEENEYWQKEEKEHLLLHKCNVYERENRELKAENCNLINESKWDKNKLIKELQAEIKELKAEIKSYIKAREGRINKIDELKAEIRELKAEVKQAVRLRDEFGQERDDNKKNVDILKAELQAEKLLNSSNRKQITKLNAEIDNV